MFQNIFSTAVESKKIISFCTYCDSATCIGIVMGYSSEQVTIEHISKYGEHDGIISLKISDIERIDVDDEMCRSINYLYHNRKEIQNLSKRYKGLDINTSDFLSFLSECKDEKLVCSVDTKELYLTCFVLDVNFEELHILAIDSHGQKDGECFVKMDDINYVSYGRLNDMRRLLLYNINYRI
ncbi:hypothetical protein N8368_02295 [Bacteroidia bacterium]|nr:hypothetical protein [Bacteroidia bacterium]MDB9882528.1 hypothetical protein [Bacteroidia bacterium]MDC1395318.1 hypothetical protein [Bacteroidia bacterium]